MKLHEEVPLRKRTYLRCLRPYRRRSRMKKALTHDWNSMPYEMEYAIVSTTLLIQRDISLRQICRYARVSKAWREHVWRFLCHDEPERKKLLDAAVEADVVGVVRMMLDRTDVCQKERKNLLHLAVWHNAIRTVKMLVGEYGFDVDVVMPWASKVACYRMVWTVLHAACFRGHIEVFELLVGSFKVLDGKSREYVQDLANVALINGMGTMYLLMVDKYGAECFR